MPEGEGVAAEAGAGRSKPDEGSTIPHLELLILEREANPAEEDVKKQATSFAPRLDFLTTPGYLSGPGARERAGLPAGTGPYKVITSMAVMGFHPVSKRMQVETLHPGVARDQVTANTGFALLWSDDLGVTPEPTDEELRILRDEVDPAGFVIGRR